MENWKTIKDYENYQISNLGNVKSLNYNKSNKEKLLKIRLLKSGYCRVYLCKNGKARDFYIHRLVAINFLLKKDKDIQVNHIDGNKSNNNIKNLEWCSQSENMIHSYKIGLNKFGEENCKSKLKNIDVLEIKNSNLPYPKLSKLFNVSKSLICCIKKGKKRIIC
jgi:hypothetical protein